MKISEINEGGPATDLVDLTLQELTNASLNTIDVSSHSSPFLWGAPVHIERNAYTFAVGKPPCGNTLDSSDRARLLDLMCSARAVADVGKCALFEHWMCQSEDALAVIHRFAVYRSSELNGAWVITQSNI
jgi:hypothetical protein